MPVVFVFICYEQLMLQIGMRDQLKNTIMLQRKGLVGEAAERTAIPDGYHEQSMIHHCGPRTGKGI